MMCNPMTKNTYTYEKLIFNVSQYVSWDWVCQPYLHVSGKPVDYKNITISTWLVKPRNKSNYIYIYKVQ